MPTTHLVFIRDLYLGYNGSTISDRMISVALTNGFYDHGAPHGQYGSFEFHWLLREGRELAASDVLAAGKPWKQAIRNACFDGVKHLGFITSPSALRDSPWDTTTWSFSRNGLTVTFVPYQVASYADGEPTVTIRWSKLKPYLSTSAPSLLGLRQ